ncbi:MAG: hypothetical protein SynsKO_25660 [Synoicihabitans sp.]
MNYIKPIAFFVLSGLSVIVLSASATTSKSESDQVTCSCCNVKDREDATPTYPLRGEVRTVMSEKNALVVRHEEIPGFMKAMTMMFQVDPELLPRIKAGDKITAQMKRSDSGDWLLEEVQIIDS